MSVLVTRMCKINSISTAVGGDAQMSSSRYKGTEIKDRIVLLWVLTVPMLDKLLTRAALQVPRLFPALLL